MSSQNLISATLSEETKTEITQALTEVRNKLEFLLSAVSRLVLAISR